MKNIIASTALALMLGTSAMAATAMDPLPQATIEQGDIMASGFIGSRVYATESEIDTSAAATPDAEKQWDDIGEINDVVLSEAGNVKYVIVGVGGFLGIGEKDVAIDMDRLKFVSDGEDPNDYFLVINANKEMLKEAPALEKSSMSKAETMMVKAGSDMSKTAENAGEKLESGAAAVGTAASNAWDKTKQAGSDMMDSTKQAANDMTATDGTNSADKMKTDQTASADNSGYMSNQDKMATGSVENPGFMKPAIQREGYNEAAREDLTTEMLTGARVYDANDNDIGEVSKLILGSGDTITEAVVDVGGFLGIGEHPVAVNYDELNIQHDANWSDVRVYINATKEQLENRPAYEG